MTVEVLRTYRYRCDTVGCTATALTPDTPPDGWTVLSSTDHQARRPLPTAKSPRARLQAMSTDGARTFGQFKVHLCPEHPDALASHLPRTDNLSLAGRTEVQVSCSCGAKIGYMVEAPAATWRRHYAEALSDAARIELPNQT